jgi:hypothetical protein
MAGVTILIPNNKNTERPKNYRPVTFLPTIHKTITESIINVYKNIRFFFN